MKVLVLNCGSSSLKYQLFDMEKESVLCKGLVERIGIEGSMIKHSPACGDSVTRERDIPNHKVAVQLVLEAILSKDYGVLESLEELTAVGHRVVHGGEDFTASVVIDDEVMKAIDKCCAFAPLHNPANLTGIRAMKETLPNIPQVAVFDTAFHQTAPNYAYMYGVPYEYYTEHGMRRYGFHGTSHRYVADRAAAMLGKKPEELKVITCHLGNGSSITAVQQGKSVDTSMGFTPLPGVLMGTRCGDVDCSLILQIMQDQKIEPQDMAQILNKKSGILSVSGVSSDLRDVEDEAAQGNPRAKLALDMLCYGIRKYIGSYAAAMNGVDAVVFTAGIGENSALIREMVCKELGFLGAEFDKNRNRTRGQEAVISTDASKVVLMVIPTN
ncbi:MAG TPA: acetate kinase, partial [Synergistaceae bacterium]|nr:acetate kinase [Synergistaceae bacterium]